MVHYTSVEQTFRTRKTEIVLNKLDTMLRDPALQEKLGETAANLLSILENQVYIPNIRHGRMYAPKGAIEDGVPVTTRLSDGEGFVLDDPASLTMTAGQELMLARQLVARGYSADQAATYISYTTTTHKDMNERTQYVSGNEKTAATTIHNVTYLRTRRNGDVAEPLQATVRTRPLIVFGSDLSTQERAGVIGFHEILHADQVLTDITGPIDSIAQRRHELRDELVAYDTSSFAACALYEYSDNPAFRGNRSLYNELDLTISHLIREMNAGKDDIYDPTEELYDAIVEQTGVEII